MKELPVGKELSAKPMKKMLVTKKSTQKKKKEKTKKKKKKTKLRKIPKRIVSR